MLSDWRELQSKSTHRSTIYENVDGDLIGGAMPTVKTRGMGFEKAMRIFKRKCEKAGIKDEVRSREYYEKPSVARNAKNNYQKRNRKLEKIKERELEIRKKMLMSARNGRR